MHEIVDIINFIERRKNSVDGNPAWALSTEKNGVLHTASDASISYELPNSKLVGVPVVIETTDRWKVYNITPVKEY